MREMINVTVIVKVQILTGATLKQKITSAAKIGTRRDCWDCETGPRSSVGSHRYYVFTLGLCIYFGGKTGRN